MIIKKGLFYNLLSIISTLVLITLLLVGKMYYTSVVEFDKGTALEQQGKIYKAMVHYDRALRCFFPYNPYNSRSFKRLLSIGKKFEEQGNSKDALVVYENIHGTLLSTQSLLTTNNRELSECDKKIKNIKSLPVPFDKGQQPIPKPPNNFLSFLQGVGLLGWIFSAVFLIYKNDNKSLIFLISFFVMWLLGISLA